MDIENVNAQPKKIQMSPEEVRYAPSIEFDSLKERIHTELQPQSGAIDYTYNGNSDIIFTMGASKNGPNLLDMQSVWFRFDLQFQGTNVDAYQAFPDGDVSCLIDSLTISTANSQKLEIYRGCAPLIHKYYLGDYQMDNKTKRLNADLMATPRHSDINYMSLNGTGAGTADKIKNLGQGGGFTSGCPLSTQMVNKG